MREEISLSLDVGSSSLKLSVISSNRGPLYFQEYTFLTKYISDSEVEIDGEMLWNQIQQGIKTTLKELSPKDSPNFLSLSTQRESVLLWSKKTGVSLSPIISWQDSRTDELVSSFTKEQRQLIRLKTGLWISSYCSAPKISYLLETISPQEDYLWGTLDSWIIYRLSNGKYFVTDYSSASRTALFSLEHLDWDAQLFELFKIPFHSLPRLVSNNAEIGDVLVESCRLNIKGVIGDQQGALYASHSLGISSTSLVYGTGAFALHLLPKDIGFKEIIHKYLNYRSLITIAWQKEGELPRFALELSFSNSSASLNWICKEFNIQMSTRMDWNEVDWKDKPFCYPFLTGKWFLSELNKRGQKASFTNIQLKTSKQDLLLSFLEGLFFSVRKALEEWDFSKTPAISVGGGLLENECFLTLQACCLNCSLFKFSHSLSGLGVALLSFSSIDIERKGKTIDPFISLVGIFEKRFLLWVDGINLNG